MARMTWKSIAVAAAFLSVAAPAHAVTFVHFIDFGAPGLGPGDTGSISVLDDAPPPWLHDIRPQLAGTAVITSATLSVSYRGTDGNESWSLTGDGVPLGSLLVTATPILTTAFPLTQAALAALQADGLLEVIPVETTPNRDGIRLYESTLSGEYTIIPEPANCWLWLIGVALWLLITGWSQFATTSRPSRAQPRFLIVWLVMASTAWLSYPSIGHAQPTDGVFMLLQDDYGATGGQTGSGTATGTFVLGGEPIGGTATDGVLTVKMGYQAGVMQSSYPARPTVAATSGVVTGTSYTLTGTKAAGTSLWINGAQIVPLNNQTTWSATVALVEGDNTFAVVTKNAAGAQSTANTINLVVDQLPPVITVTTPARTNISPCLLTGTVDDSLTTVMINGQPATRQGRAFQTQLSLVPGANPVTISAISPNNRTSTMTLTITLGTAPTITAFLPPAGAKRYVASTVTIQITATDQQNDPLEYQISLDGQVVRDWSASPSYTWTPTTAALGAHLLEARVRDGGGGDASAQHAVVVLHPPVAHP